jgi:hypothetical protein
MAGRLRAIFSQEGPLMPLSPQRRFTTPAPAETLEQLAARVLPDEPLEAAMDKVRSWNLHIFALRREPLILGSDVVFVEPPRT